MLRAVVLVAVFSVAFFATAYGDKVYRYAIDQADAARDESRFNEPPVGCFLYRGTHFELDSVERWRSEAEQEIGADEYALFSLSMYVCYVEKDYPAALPLFERTLREARTPPVKAAALFESGVCQLMAGYGDAGLQSLDEFLSRYPSSWRAPAAVMYKAVYYRELGKMEKARELFSRVVVEFPLSPQVPKALESLEKLRQDKENN
ncbi:MAG: tetratricopeptide repeat protein [Planctomycetota bacterium]|nr:tetratricopeptide repeat protein [Planctomycetota bacterium]